MKSKGGMALEFVVAITLFLSAFWFIYIQSAAILIPKTVRDDVRQPGAELLASILIHDPGSPAEWKDNPERQGLAYNDGKTYYNILDKDKLDWMDSQDCNNIVPPLFIGLQFAVEVSTTKQTWSCASSIRKEAVVKRPIYVYRRGNSYDEGVLKVWVA